MESVGMHEDFWNDLPSIISLNDQPETVCRMDDHPDAVINRGAHDWSGGGGNLEAVGSSTSVSSGVEIHDRLLRKQCEALFECGAQVPPLIAAFLNKTGRKSVFLDGSIVYDWLLEKRAGAPSWGQAYRDQHTLALKYRKFLDERWIMTAGPSQQKALIREERRAVDTSPLYSLRVACEVLFKHGAGSPHFIAQFLSHYKRGKIVLRRQKVQTWRERRRNLPLCAADRDERRLVPDYCRFLDEWGGKASTVSAKRRVEMEKARVMEHMRNCGPVRQSSSIRGKKMRCLGGA